MACNQMKDFLLNNNIREVVFTGDFKAGRNQYSIYKKVYRILIEKAKKDLGQNRLICLYALPFFLKYIKRIKVKELSC